ncbi:MAG TPA: Hsp33 family molecular chaperone HslO [Polyangia bacterium]|jgi:molecular chaperone Hsp33|nr:Hsp33 family molecular chaperone HslO [Polyangia bacterium]
MAAAKEPEQTSTAEVGDEIIRCTADGGAVRVVAVTATDVAREAIRRHGATGASAIALARGLASGLLLATLTKDRERVTLQLLGDGPLGGLTVDATSEGTARAYVKNVDAPVNPEVTVGRRPVLARALGATGVVSVVRDLGMRESFRGQTSFASGEIDEDCERYLNESEQVDSAIRCETVLGPDGALIAVAGILVQALPGGRGATIVAKARERLVAGALRDALAKAHAPGSTTPTDPGTLVDEALGDLLGVWHALDARPVRFHCPCSRERAGASLALLGAAELAEMILEDGKAEVVCNFCRARHDFGEAELELIRRELQGPADPPS